MVQRYLLAVLAAAGLTSVGRADEPAPPPVPVPVKVFSFTDLLSGLTCTESGCPATMRGQVVAVAPPPRPATPTPPPPGYVMDPNVRLDRLMHQTPEVAPAPVPRVERMSVTFTQRPLLANPVPGPSLQMFVAPPQSVQLPDGRMAFAPPPMGMVTFPNPPALATLTASTLPQAGTPGVMSCWVMEAPTSQPTLVTRPVLPNPVPAVSPPPMLVQQHPYSVPFNSTVEPKSDPIFVNIALISVAKSYEAEFLNSLKIAHSMSATTGRTVCPQQMEQVVNMGRGQGFIRMLAHPRLMLQNNQSGQMTFGDKSETSSLHFTPRIAPDRQSVLIRLAAQRSTAGANPWVRSEEIHNHQTTVVCPTGGTMLVPGMTRIGDVRVRQVNGEVETEKQVCQEYMIVSVMLPSTTPPTAVLPNPPVAAQPTPTQCPVPQAATMPPPAPVVVPKVVTNPDQIRLNMAIVSVADADVGSFFQVLQPPATAVAQTGTNVAPLSCCDKTQQCLDQVVKMGRAMVLSRPQMNLGNNQCGTFEMCGETAPAKPTIRLSVTPQLSADRRYVMLRMECKMTQPTATPVRLTAGTDTPEPVAFAHDTQMTSLNFVCPKQKTMIVPVGVYTVDTRDGTVARREVRRQFLIVTPSDPNVPVMPAVAPLAPACGECAAVSKPCAGCCEQTQNSEVTKLVAGYREAIAAGKTEDAMKLALKALALDPGCFATK